VGTESQGVPGWSFVDFPEDRQVNNLPRGAKEVEKARCPAGKKGRARFIVAPGGAWKEGVQSETKNEVNHKGRR
jgi:hypothetical protein